MNGQYHLKLDKQIERKNSMENVTGATEWHAIALSLYDNRRL
ncbi:unnamed protein product, partial [Rotaria magnacalcarata]